MIFEIQFSDTSHIQKNMKRLLQLAIIICIGFSDAYAQSGICDTSYWNHTYLNNRLKVYDSCVTVTATIYLLDPPFLTGDGDYYIYTTPDSAYAWMVNYRTPSFLKYCLGTDSSAKFTGKLNVEEVCKGTITDGGTDGVIENAACNGFNDTVYLPNIGEHVKIIGPFIYDTVHCWNEIHPVSTMVVIPALGVNEINGAALADGLKVYPQPANTNVKFQFEHAPHTITLVKIYTITGQQLLVYALYETNTLDLDVSTWPAGEYLYNIVLKDQNKTIKSGKITVAR
jgi:hypothetical protein